MTHGLKLGLSADEVLTTTRAVRKRLDFTRPVEREVLQDCVEIARQAPSGRNRQRWDFIFVGDEATKTAVTRWWLAGLRAGAPGGSDTRDPSPTGWQRIAESLGDLAARLHEAPWLLIPCVRVESRAELADVRGQAGAWGSVLPAVWSFMLALRSRGRGSAWTTLHLVGKGEKLAADVLGIPFDQYRQGGLFPIAYTKGTDFKKAQRLPAERFTHWNEW